MEEKLGVTLPSISQFNFSEEEAKGRNIENLVGATQVPLGVAGPLKIAGLKEECYIPLATTEGALVASISRGCKAITSSGGAMVAIENVGITRGPVFVTHGIEHNLLIKKWLDNNLNLLKKVVSQTSPHIGLLKVGARFTGRNFFIRAYFDTTDAMGMNMATIATEEMAKLIEKKTKCRLVSVAGNFDVDKKPSFLNVISGRGRRAWAEVTLDKKVLRDVLKTTAPQLAEVVYRKCQIGSAMSGSLGFNAHFANIIAAIFIATGQDIAHVVEGSLGITTAEVEDNDKLYFSIYLPSLVVGTIGGGNGLPTQKEAKEIMSIKNTNQFTQVIAAAVLAGELSLLASQAQGSLVRAHIELGRRGKK